MTRIALLPLLSSGCFIANGSGISEEEFREVTAFDAVANETFLDTFVIEGEVPSVLVRCDDNLLDLIETDVDGGTLVIDTENNTSINPRTACEVEVTTRVLHELVGTGSGRTEADGEWPDLREVHSSGSGAVMATGSLTGLDFAQGSGSGRLTVRGIDSQHVALECSGSGGVLAEGVADSAELTNTGSGGIDAYDLVVIDGDILNTGSGKVSLTATGQVVVELDGSGAVVIGGDAGIDGHDNGSGDIVRR